MTFSNVVINDIRHQLMQTLCNAEHRLKMYDLNDVTSQLYGCPLPSITISRDLYEEIFKCLDSRDEYKHVSLNDFIEHLLIIGVDNIVAVESIKKDKRWTLLLLVFIFSVCIGIFCCMNMDKINKRLDVTEKVLQVQNNEKVK